MKSFLLQLEKNGHYSEDVAVVARLIGEYNWLYPNDRIKIYECKFEDLVVNRLDKESIPVGSIEFVNKYLDIIGSQPMKPINIPTDMQKPLFLQRRLMICPTEDVLSKFSEWQTNKLFIKSHQHLKTDYTGIYTYRDIQSSPSILEHMGNKCLISEPVKFVSEWRCFVYKGELKDMKCYLGDFWTLPNQTFIEACIDSAPEDLEAYTLDVGVMDDGGNAIVELHNFVSCGLYGFDDSCILKMLRVAFRKEKDKFNIRDYSDQDDYLFQLFQVKK